MSTTPIESWSGDLEAVSFIHPFAGYEFPMVVIGVVLWIAWHVWQVQFENNTYKEDIAKHATSENLRKATSGEI